MSAWKRVGLEKLPEYRQIIEAADKPMSLWVELLLKFEDAYRAPVLDDDLIGRFYDYAYWSLGVGGDVGTAAALAFYEGLPTRPAVRRDIHRWLTREVFHGLREIFQCHLSPEQYKEFESEFMDRGEKYARMKGRPRPGTGS